jgi:hypothetical protein
MNDLAGQIVSLIDYDSAKALDAEGASRDRDLAKGKNSLALCRLHEMNVLILINRNVALFKSSRDCKLNLPESARCLNLFIDPSLCMLYCRGQHEAV